MRRSRQKTVLVTGGAGYVGSHLVRKLLDRGYEVHVIDNFMYGRAGLHRVQDHPGLRLFEGDICNIKDVVRAVQGVGSVVALAAIVGDPACNLNEQETLSTNYEATKVLVGLCKYYQVGRLLFASSCSVYGANRHLELDEGSWLNPVSLYARTRVMSEEVILQHSGPVCPVVYRLATVFGRSDRMRFDLVVNILTAKAHFAKRLDIHGGDQYRPNLHVQDAADAFICGLEIAPDICRKQIFNIGRDDQNLSIRGIGERVRAAVPGARMVVHRKMEDRRDYRVSFRKARHLLGFRPRFTVEDGVRELLRAFRRGEFGDYQEDRYYNVRYAFR